MADFPPAEPASATCSGKAQPGCVAFAAWAVGDFGRGATNLGIYNCRTIAGSTNRSTHGDGRAVDVGFALVNSAANPAGTLLVHTLLPHVRALGIQRIIWNRTRWDAQYPNGGPHTGTSGPHLDHTHVEFTWATARTLTRDQVRRIVGGTPAPAPTPTPVPDPTLLEDEEMAVTIRLAVAGHKHNGRVEKVTDMHRRWITPDELKLYSFLGGKIVTCTTAAQFNSWTANKAAIGSNGINGPI